MHFNDFFGFDSIKSNSKKNIEYLIFKKLGYDQTNSVRIGLEKFGEFHCVHVLCWLIRLQNLEFISNIKNIITIEKFLSFMF